MSLQDKIKSARVERTLMDEALSPADLLASRLNGQLSCLIVNRRKELELSQGEVAKRMGVSQSVISRLETGEMSFTVEYLSALSIALDLVVAEPLLKK